MSPTERDAHRSALWASKSLEDCRAVQAKHRALVDPGAGAALPCRPNRPTCASGSWPAAPRGGHDGRPSGHGPGRWDGAEAAWVVARGVAKGMVPAPVC